MRYLKICLLPLLLCFTVAAHAQLTEEQLSKLEKNEDTLKQHARAMIFAEVPSIRFMADSSFIRAFVRTLKTPNSFYYPFDSLETISRLYAPDSSFRIFTWQFMKDETYFRQRGAIQMKTSDGSLKLIPLFDNSEFTNNPFDSVRTNANWIGAIYYGMVMKTFNNRKYYTLLGYDDYNFTSTRKWLEMLTFDDKGNPEFGGRFFVFPPDSIKPPPNSHRFCLEYKKDARARLNYDPELDLIIFDHLVSESKEPSKKFTLIPDGDQEGFRWKDGKWVYVEKIFDQKLEDGKFPLEMPIKDNAGNTNEEKLWEQSQKNLQRAKAAEEKRKAEQEKKKQQITPAEKKQPAENEY